MQLPELPAEVAAIDVEAAAGRISGAVRRTPLEAFPSGDERVELRLKLENLQTIGAFKARGAWNQISQLTDSEKAAGVAATSSGNHARALAWAARRAGVRATLFMPRDAYPNKIQACRDEGAEVVLCPTREAAERECDERVAAGAVLVHPYDALRTMEGAGTVGLEIAEDWPDVDVVIIPCGGGGLLSGSSIALRAALGQRVFIMGCEPAGAPSMTRGIAQGRQVDLAEITTGVQGLCPINSGALPIAVVTKLVDAVVTLEDEDIFAAQAHLLRNSDWPVEPAGAAAFGVVLAGQIPTSLLAGRSPAKPLRVAAVVSGGNGDPEQMERLRGGA